MRSWLARSYASNMKQPNYRIVPLPSEVADAARRAVAASATDHAVVTADAPNAYPCRHCLHWAEPGDELILFPFASVDGGPYQERGPIFVHAERCTRYAETESYPEAFRNSRVIRAYDTRKFMIDARVVNGEGPEQLIEELLANPQVAFLHVRSVTRGCYTMGVERV